jgi:hypothetical protein
MQCPFDSTTLQVLNRSGVDVDWCPSCKGVWLERGELDKLIDHVTRTLEPPPSPVGAMDRDDDDDWADRRTGRDGFRPKKRKNFLSEMFDF